MLLYIVGYPCSGKTTLSEKLKLNYGFHLIEFGEIVQQFINTHQSAGTDNSSSSTIPIQELINKLNSGKLMDISPQLKAELINGEVASVQQKYGNDTKIIIYSLPKDSDEAHFLPIPTALIFLETKDKQILFERAQKRRIDSKKSESNHHLLNEYNLDVDNNLFKKSIANDIFPQKIEKSFKNDLKFEKFKNFETKKIEEKNLKTVDFEEKSSQKSAKLRFEECWKNYPLKRIGDEDKQYFEMRIQRFERRWHKIKLFYETIEKTKGKKIIFEFETSNQDLDTISKKILEILKNKEKSDDFLS